MDLRKQKVMMRGREGGEGGWEEGKGRLGRGGKGEGLRGEGRQEGGRGGDY